MRIRVLGVFVAVCLTACGGSSGGSRAASTSAGVAAESSEGITSLAVLPSGRLELTQAPGAGFQIAVDGHGVDQAPPVDLTREVTYEVADPRVATISGDGLIAPVGTGVTAIRVRWTSPSGRALETATEVTVEAAPAVTVTTTTSATAMTPATRTPATRTPATRAPATAQSLPTGGSAAQPMRAANAATLATPTGTAAANAAATTATPTPALALVELEIFPSHRALPRVDVQAGVRQHQQLVVVGTDVDGRRHDLTRDVAIQLLGPDGEPTLIAAHVSPSGLLTGGVNGEVFAVVRLDAQGLLAASHLVLGDGTSAPVDPTRFFSGAPLAGSSNPIDQAILQNLEPLHLEPAPLADDGEFLRRLYGDTLDRAPTLAELEAFAADAAADKRARAIDVALADPAFARRWAAVIGEWLEMPRKAFIAGDALQRFDLSAPRNTLAIAVNGGAAQTITFVEADFPNQGITGALAEEVVNKINQSLQGARAVRDVEVVTLISSQPGYGQSLEVLPGAGATELGLAGKTSAVIDTWAQDPLTADATLGQMVSQLVRGMVPAFEAAKPTAADKVDVLLLATTGMTAKCAKCHDHPLTAPTDTIRWTQQQRYPIDAFFAETLQEATPYDARTGLYVGRPLQPFFALSPNAQVGVQLSSPLVQRRDALARVLTQSDAFRRGLAHRVFAEVAAPLLDPNQFLERNVAAVAVPNVLQTLTDVFTQQQGSLRGYLRVVFNSRYYQLSSADGGRDLQRSDPYLYRRTLRLRHAEVVAEHLDEATGRSLTAARDSEFLHDTFGYPDRRLTVTERRLGVNLSQALLLLNSPVVHDRLNANGANVPALAAAVDAGSKTRAAAVTELFLATLAREPDAEELACSLDAIDAAPDVGAGLADVAAALLAAAEFSLD